MTKTWIFDHNFDLFQLGGTTVEWNAEDGGSLGFSLFDINGDELYRQSPTQVSAFDNNKFLVPKKVQKVVFSTVGTDGFRGTFQLIHKEKTLELECQDCQNGNQVLDKIYLDTDMNENHPTYANCKGTCTFEIGKKSWLNGDICTPIFISNIFLFLHQHVCMFTS